MSSGDFAGDQNVAELEERGPISCRRRADLKVAHDRRNLNALGAATGIALTPSPQYRRLIRSLKTVMVKKPEFHKNPRVRTASQLLDVHR
jgi:hypothetical protein